MLAIMILLAPVLSVSGKEHGVFSYMIRTIADSNVKIVLIDPDNGKVYQEPQGYHSECNH
jgi:hypothetical protein